MSKYDDQANNYFELALSEIEMTYGTPVRANRKTLLKFGLNQDVDTAEEIISYNGIEYRKGATDDVTHVNSTSAGDVGNVVNLDTFYYSGTDLVFKFQSVTLNGLTPVALGTPCNRVSRIKRANGSDVLGDVYAHINGSLTSGVPALADTACMLVQTEQTSLACATTVASTNYLIITNMSAQMLKATGSGAEADMRLEIRDKDATLWRTVEVFSCAKGTPEHIDFVPFVIVEPNHDVRITAEGSTANIQVSASFSGYFADIY